MTISPFTTSEHAGEASGYYNAVWSDQNLIGSSKASLALAVVLLTSLGLLWRQKYNSNSKTTSDHDPSSSLRSSIPHVPSPIPFLGLGLTYFRDGPFPLLLRLTKQYGNTFVATIFGKPWLFVMERIDQETMLKAPEKQVSMLKVVSDLGGFTFPQENSGDYPNATIEKRISFQKGLGPSNIPAIIHSLKKDKLMAWIPPLRKLLRDIFTNLPANREGGGTVSLFDWCQELITTITVRVLLGEEVTNNRELLDTYIKLFQEGDPEVAFAGARQALETFAETMVWGERRVFTKVRALLEPYLDAEIQRICVNKAVEDPGESILQSFVRSWFNKLDHNVEFVKYAKRRLLNELFLFTFAAFTNSYGGAGWLFYHILMNTNGCADKILLEIQQMQQQWDQDSAANRNPTDFHCPNLEWTLLEISRLYTPGSVLRETMVPVTLPSCGVTVPPGTTVNISVGMMMRNPKIFPDNPLDFDFLRHSPERRAQNPNYFMTPFGAGTHPCAGRKFAIYEMALFVMEALTHLDLSLEGLPQMTDEFTKQAIGNKQPHHPHLDDTQAMFIWRPKVPVIVRYKKKKESQN